MKAYLLLFLLSIFYYTHGISQIQDSTQHSLVGKNKSKLRDFFIGNKVAIKYNGEQTEKDCKGVIADFSQKTIYISSFKKKDTTLRCISVDSIISIHKLLRKSRLTSAIVIGVSIIVTLAAIHFIEKSKSTNLLSGIYEIYPATGISIGMGLFISTYINQALHKASVKKGWHFSIQ